MTREYEGYTDSVSMELGLENACGEIEYKIIDADGTDTALLERSMVRVQKFEGIARFKILIDASNQEVIGTFEYTLIASLREYPLQPTI